MSYLSRAFLFTGYNIIRGGDDMFERIRNLREDSDKTQKEVAQYLFCDQSLYSKYERGIREVPVSIIIKLAKFYNTTTDYILGLSDEKNSQK